MQEDILLSVVNIFQCIEGWFYEVIFTLWRYTRY